MSRMRLAAAIAVTVAISLVVVLESFHDHRATTGLTSGDPHTCFLCQVSPGAEPASILEASGSQSPLIAAPRNVADDAARSPCLLSAPARAPPV